MKRMIALLFLLVAASIHADEKQTVVFMCPYGGAKSVVAAEYFNRAAAKAELPVTGIAVSAEEPYDAVPPKVADYLANDGIEVRDFKPRRVQPDDLRNAARVVSIDCDLAKLDAQGASIEQWNDVPKISADLPVSVAAIRKHVDALIEQLKSAE